MAEYDRNEHKTTIGPKYSQQSVLVMSFSLMIKFLQVIIFLSCFRPAQSYPTGYILSKNPHIRKETIELSTQFSIPSNPPYTYNPAPLTNFKTTTQPKLKPFMCLSKVKEYNFQQVNYVLAFSVRVDVVDDSSPDTTYTVEVGSLYQRQAMTGFTLHIIFFSKDTETLLNQETPIFYSFYYSSDKLHPNKKDLFYEPINLPTLVGDPQFILPSPTNNYKVVWYLTGVDIWADPVVRVFGINTEVSILDQKQLNLKVEFKKPNHDGTVVSVPRFIRLLQLSIFLYNPTQLLKTQHFFQHLSALQLQVSTGWQFTTHNYTHTTLQLSNDFIFGMEGIIMGNDIRKLNYQLTGTSSSDNKQIQLDITIDSSLHVNILQANFLFGAWVECPQGYRYEKDMNDIVACIQGYCKVNYYFSNKINYGRESCFECVSPCLIYQGQTTPTCLDEDLKPQVCTAEPSCFSNETKIPKNFNPLLTTGTNSNNYGSSSSCLQCHFLFGPDCLQCTYQECTRCNPNTTFYIDSCQKPVPDPDPCPLHQQKDKMTGKCMDIVEFKLINWEKVQFMNKVIVNFKLSYPVWNATSSLNQQVDLQFSDNFADRISQVLTAYDPVQEKFSVQITYNNTWVQGLQLTASLNFDPLTLQTLKFTSPQTSTVKLQMSRMELGYFLINHDPQVLTIATLMTVFYKFAAIIGFGFILVGYVGGKYIVLQVLAVLQIAFLGLLQLQKYTPFHLAANRLSIIAGNFVFEPSSLEQMNQLNTLKLEVDFLGNFNIQIALFTIFLLIGVCLLIYSKVKKSQQSVLPTLIGMILVCQYSLYGLLIFSYFASASIGLQIKYQFIDKVAAPNYLSLSLGLLYIVVVIVYMIIFLKKKRYFGEFVREMEMFSINECFICFLTAEKIIVGFLLGILCSFKYIGFLLAALEMIFLAYAIIKQPFYYGFHTNRLVCDHGWIIAVLIGYNIQRLFFEDYSYIDSNPWMYAWPLTILVGIYIIFIKNAIAMGKQIRVCIFRIKSLKKIYEDFTQYCQQNKNLQETDIEEVKKVFLQKNLPEKIQLTDKQIKMWKNLESVQKQQNQFTTNNQYEQLRQQQQLLQNSFKAKKELKRLKDNIKKKIKAKKHRQEKIQKEQLQNQQNINDSEYQSLESKRIRKSEQKDQEFESLLSRQKQREKMTPDEHWMEIDKQVKRFENLDQVKETPQELEQKYQGLKFVHGNKTMVKLSKNKTIPIKNLKILQMNPILNYYRNELDFELHAKVNPFEEIKEELQRQKQKLQDLSLAHQRKLQEEMAKQRIKQKEEKPVKKLMYRGGQKFGDLAKNLNDKNAKK